MDGYIAADVFANVLTVVLCRAFSCALESPGTTRRLLRWQTRPATPRVVMLTVLLVAAVFHWQRRRQDRHRSEVAAVAAVKVVPLQLHQESRLHCVSCRLKTWKV